MALQILLGSCKPPSPLGLISRSQDGPRALRTDPSPPVSPERRSTVPTEKTHGGGQAPVSAQALWTSPVLTGTPRGCPRHPQTRPGALRRSPPFGARLRLCCPAGGRPAKSSRPRGVWGGPQDYQRPDSAPPTPIGPSPAARTTAAILPRRSGCGSGPGAGRGGAGWGGSRAEGGGGRS